MINIKELEQFESQLPYFGELLIKVLLKNSMDRDSIIEKLVVYLKSNPEVQVLSIRKIDGETNLQMRWMLRVKFKCSQCKQISTEDTNLMCFWNPTPSDSREPVCENCMDKFREYAQDEINERDYEEEKVDQEEETQSKTITKENGKEIK